MMRINYATNNGFSEEHTGANVPLFANDVAGSWLSHSSGSVRCTMP